MLLTPEELAEYAPSVASCDLSSVSPIALIANAQAIATGPRGSNRKLELAQHKETLTTGRSMLTCLKNWPIVVDETHLVSVNYRLIESGLSALDRFQPMTAEEYSINENGRLSLHLENLVLSPFGRRSRWNLRPHQKAPRIELEVTYWGGFDFSSSDDDVIQMKAALGGIISLQATAATALQGLGNGDTGDISEVEIDDNIKVKTSSNSDKKAIAAAQITALSGSASPLDVYLSVFRQYRAKLLPV